MPEFEVGVVAFDHYHVEAESHEEAKEMALEEARGDIPMGWDIDEVNPVLLPSRK